MARLALAAALLLFVQLVAAAVVLESECPGNLLRNGGFETPDTTKVRSEVWNEGSSNSKWGWYRHRIDGWYTTRPDGKPCVVVDWPKPHIEIAHGALATPVEGRQYGELLPNATGNYCQDVKVVQGAAYRLSYYYGRLMTTDKHTRQFTAYETAVDVAIRPAAYVPAAGASRWPGDKQGFTQVSYADTAQQWGQHKTQWVKHEATFTAPSDAITLAFINAKRSKECGSCGSLLDAVCLQKV